MNIVVTGGAGFIGSNLVKELQSKGHQVMVVDDYSSGNFHNLQGFTGRLLIGDESRLTEIEEDIDYVFHQAAITDTTFEDDKEMLRKNIDGFRKVLLFCQQKQCPLIYASSAGVYGAGKVPMKESSQLRPLNAYGYSKYMMDVMAKQEKSSFPIIGLRYFNVFGPGEQYKGKSASMIYQLALQMKSNRRPRIFKHGEQQRDHIYVKDVVSANIKAMNAKQSGVFNVGSGKGTSFNEVIKYLNLALKTEYTPDYFDNPFTDVYQNNTQADITKTTKALKWRPQYSVKKGILEYMKTLP